MKPIPNRRRHYNYLAPRHGESIRGSLDRQYWRQQIGLLGTESRPLCCGWLVDRPPKIKIEKHTKYDGVLVDVGVIELGDRDIPKYYE